MIYDRSISSLASFPVDEPKDAAQNSTFAPTNKILVNVSGESKQNIRLNINKNMTTAEAMNLPI